MFVVTRFRIVLIVGPVHLQNVNQSEGCAKSLCRDDEDAYGIQSLKYIGILPMQADSM